jgi:hypothetical protein
MGIKRGVEMDSHLSRFLVYNRIVAGRSPRKKANPM